MSAGVPASFFHAIYDHGAPWDIGGPQPSLVDWVERHQTFLGRVLDVGAGQGDNAIYLARQGRDVVGLDVVPRAVDIARRRAQDSGVHVDFRVFDALALETLGEAFDCVLDSAFFHVLSDADRPRLVRGLRSVLKPGGELLVLCFSDREGPGASPRRISEAELRDAFADGFVCESIEPTVFRERTRPAGAQAWRAHFLRTP